jgi:acetaldehyde dehydrogenase (acetylating)
MHEATGVLREDEALELFAYLLTSARTQLDDPARYASMRLLSAAEALRDMVAGRVSPDVDSMFDATVRPASVAQEQVNDREVYTRSLDELCAIVARTLVARAGLEEAPDG